MKIQIVKKGSIAKPDTCPWMVDVPEAKAVAKPDTCPWMVDVPEEPTR
jgi:proline-rich tail region repeat protein